MVYLWALVTPSEGQHRTGIMGESDIGEEVSDPVTALRHHSLVWPVSRSATRQLSAHSDHRVSKIRFYLLFSNIYNTMYVRS